MNERFVCIKVDREERPDVDAVCMEACQAMTGQGGWPLNAFLTPDQAAVLRGHLLPARVAPRAAELADGAGGGDRGLAGPARGRVAVESAGDQLDRRQRPAAAPLRSRSPQGLLDEAVSTLRASSYDERNGGFGRAPKFPMSSVIEFLLMRGEREMSLQTLRAMAAGGIYDQVGGGFSRYAVDATWTVPHFEKMLYDNALLARAYLHGWQVSGDATLRRVCCETLDWALREMRGPEGGFCSALDADSEGVEGKFYVWTLAELRDAARAELADDAVAYFGATASGNFEGAANVLEARGPEPASARRSGGGCSRAVPQRIRPGLDDKRLTSWNALMITALAEAGAVLERADYLEAASECAEFVLGRLRDADGRLLRTWKDGRAHIAAYLEDHAYLLQALLPCCTRPRSTRAGIARRWPSPTTMIERFADRERGGFFTTAADVPRLFGRRKDLEDSPIPSGSSAAAFGLLRLALLSGDDRYEQRALGVLRAAGRVRRRHPLAFGHLLQALDFYLAAVREVAIVGAGPLTGAQRHLVRVPRRRLPAAPTAWPAAPPTAVPLLRGRTTVDGRPRPTLRALRVPVAGHRRPTRWQALLAERPGSEDRQVALELPGRDLDAVVVPLLALDLDVAVEHVLAQRAQHELGLGGQLDRLAQRLGQLLDPEAPALVRRQVVEVLLHRVGQLVAVLDALQARLQQHREGQVGVAGRVRAAQLHPRRLLLARVIQRHPHQRRAVAARPGDVDGRLVAGHQALVGVDPLGEDRADLAGVAQLAGDERLADVGEVVRVVGVEEGVAARRGTATGGCACRSRSRRTAAWA